MKFRLSPQYIPLLATTFVLVGLYTAGCAHYHNFSSLSVLVNLFGDNAFLGVAAIGETLVILSGGIDLSVGAVVAFTSVFVAWLVESRGMNPVMAITISLLLGTGFGGLMGAIIEGFKLPAFLVTLAGMFFARGMGFVVHPESLGIKHEFFVKRVNEDFAISLTDKVSIPFTAMCFLALLLLALVVAHYTRFGRYIYALGGDENSARLMGLPVARTKIMTYACAGLCSALAGVVYSFYTQSGDPASCVGLELDAIASAVIGGTLLSGGVGFMAGTAMGVLILGLIQNIINFQGNINSWWTRIIVGLLVLAFILLQNIVSLVTRNFGRSNHTA